MDRKGPEDESEQIHAAVRCAAERCQHALPRGRTNETQTENDVLNASSCRRLADPFASANGENSAICPCHFCDDVGADCTEEHHLPSGNIFAKMIDHGNVLRAPCPLR